MLTQSDAYFFVNIFKGGGYRHLSNTYRLYGKCIGDGSVLKSKLKRPVSVRTPQNVGAVRAVLLRSTGNKKSCSRTWDLKTICAAKVLDKQWFTQDGAKPHTTDVVLDYLHQTVNENVISN